MTEFKHSLWLVATICGLITSPPMMLTVVTANMSRVSDWARTSSAYCALGGIILLVICLFALAALKKTGAAVKKNSHEGKIPGLAIASVVLGFPVFGLMTWGIASLAGIVCGIVALKRICATDNLGGKSLAIIGICLSFSVIPLLPLMLLFLGP